MAVGKDPWSILAHNNLMWKICAVCGTNAGACIQCTSCDVPIHVTCAQTAGYVLGFDVQPIKSSQSRRDSLALVRLGGEAGLLTPVLHCPDHDLKRFTIHPPSQASADLSVTALALYNRTYKTTLTKLFRRGRSIGTQHDRLGNFEQLQLKVLELGTPNSEEDNKVTEQVVSRHRCARCQIEFSPHFYHEAIPERTVRATNKLINMGPIYELCHRCHWNEPAKDGNFTATLCPNL